ncbi:dihydrofolate reductase [Volucribacter psittacicida]|uniref:Dihydrofolate reductase n=1 Tax=Volucribacter psittacicida TaxID=203482 RepID=A0A4R1FQR2_9PAST|nr:type 3 dihydrofolate reductase [Volucribacter psittacicida]TCJ94658.1 dihydrofolate reductase [Volucribacter psittacicida]
MTLSMIVAMTQNRVIGKDNQMPWHLPADLAWFKQHTLGKPVIMGRKTFESIGRALPKRPNIILSRSAFHHQDIQVVQDMETALALSKDYPEAMLIGGGQLFEQYIDKVDRLYLTIIQTELAGDTFFPELDWTQWHIQSELYRPADEQNAYDLRFFVLERCG